VIAILASAIDPTLEKWVAKEWRACCMEHAIHCMSRAFISKMGLVPMVSIKLALSLNPGADTIDEGGIEDPAADVNVADDDTDFDPADLLGKVLAFVNQVCSSPQAHAFFQKLCKDESLEPLQLLKWVRTCWASLYDLIRV
jgi:hypothetical protein